ncbi:MAG: PEP-CTERM sorting domain-containing protein [Desulfobacterales bacterium]|nr:PEP-CTERM sorting domain-containing protein [Desulfobacterales bacterium]
MNKRYLVSILTMCFLSLLFSTGALAWHVDISSDYLSGDAQATFNFTLHNSETIEQLSGYRFVFEYDSEELTYLSYTNTPVPAFFPNLFGEPVDENGMISNFNASGFSKITLVPGEYQLGSFTFDVSDTAVADGVSDFNFDLDNFLFEFVIGLDDYSDSTQFIESQIDVGSAASVPVPSALLLMGTGILGLAGLRRKFT